MKKNNLLIFLFCLVASGLYASPGNLLIYPDAYDLSPEQQAYYDVYAKSRYVSKVQVVTINTEVLHNNTITLNLPDKVSYSVKKDNEEMRAGNSFSWFGKTSETGISVHYSFFNGELVSNLHMPGKYYSLQPISGGLHVLVEYGEVGEGEIIPEDGNPVIDNDGMDIPGGTTQDASSCIIRVYVAYTNSAATKVPHIGNTIQFAIDEANIAYANSGVIQRVELCRTEQVNYTESNTTNSSGFSTDLLRFQNGGDGVMDNIQTTAAYYESDIQVLMTDNNLPFFGEAFAIMAADNNQAYLVMDVTSIALGRFTLAHEMGHLMGLRHDNDPGGPAYCHGFVTANWRTIMAVGCNNFNGCRIQFFSNPGISFGGVPTGNPCCNDEARRLNETEFAVKSFRTTSNSKLLPTTESLFDKTFANYLAIDDLTSIADIHAFSGSHTTMRASQSVTILPGFTVDFGSYAKIYNASCEDVVNYSAPPQGFSGNKTNNSLPVKDNMFGRANDLNADEISGKNALDAFPNPFSGATTIKYAIAENNVPVTLEVYDIHGRLLKVLENGSVKPRGSYQVMLDGADYGEGVYYYRLKAGAFFKTNQLLIVH